MRSQYFFCATANAVSFFEIAMLCRIVLRYATRAPFHAEALAKTSQCAILALEMNAIRDRSLLSHESLSENRPMSDFSYGFVAETNKKNQTAA